MKLPIFTTFVVFALFVKIISTKNTKTFAEQNQSFLEKERKANCVRRKPIDDLPYITVPIASLPLDCLEDENAKEYSRVLREVAEKKILNLTGISNTDLKLQYGAPNISFLMEYDQNYTVLVRNLAFLAEKYVESGLQPEARTLLEYGVSIASDVKKNYELLGRIYADRGEYSKIRSLMEKAEILNSLSKGPIIRCLKELLPD